MSKPYIICHMVMSLDCKVTGNFLSKPECKSAIESYYQINRDYRADAFVCGRITMEESFIHDYQPDLSGFADGVIQREDYVADKDASFFAVAFFGAYRITAIYFKKAVSYVPKCCLCKTATSQIMTVISAWNRMKRQNL